MVNSSLFPYSLFVPLNEYNVSSRSQDAFGRGVQSITKSGLISNKWSHARGLEVEKQFFIFFNFFILSYVSDLGPVMVLALGECRALITSL